jgi:WD40 repeat protein
MQPVVSLPQLETTGALFAAGSLHIFDRRLRPEAVFRTSEGHHAWVRNVHWQTHGSGELVSGSADGAFVVWDVRKVVPSVITIPQPKGLAGRARILCRGPFSFLAASNHCLMLVLLD